MLIQQVRVRLEESKKPFSIERFNKQRGLGFSAYVYIYVCTYIYHLFFKPYLTLRPFVQSVVCPFPSTPNTVSHQQAVVAILAWVLPDVTVETHPEPLNPKPQTLNPKP